MARIEDEINVAKPISVRTSIDAPVKQGDRQRNRRHHQNPLPRTAARQIRCVRQPDCQPSDGERPATSRAHHTGPSQTTGRMRWPDAERGRIRQDTGVLNA